MAFVKQYPHFLFIVPNNAESVQDENGDWSEEPCAPKFISMCREEEDGRGTEIQVAGGTFHKVTSLIQLPTSCPEVQLGECVIVANDKECTDIRIKSKCLRFAHNQLHSRLWV